MSFEDIVVERHDAVAHIRINRPQTRNACRRQTVEEMAQAVRQHTGSGAKAFVLSGDANAFSAGADLKQMRSSTNEQRDANIREVWLPFLEGINHSKVPFIAAIRGHCVAGGLEIVLACHLRIASPDAKLGLPEILRGHIPGAGGTVRLPRLVGEGNALRYLLTGDSMSADDALRMGLVNEIKPAEEVISYSIALAQRIASLSAKAIELTLRSVVGNRDLSMAQALQEELQMCIEMREDRAYAEGLAAFAEKRPADYR